MLVVEGEPGDVDLAGGLEDSRRNIEHGTVFGDDDVCLEGSVEALISAVVVSGIKSGGPLITDLL